jgi:hypothetical protein
MYLSGKLIFEAAVELESSILASVDLEVLRIKVDRIRLTPTANLSRQKMPCIVAPVEPAIMIARFVSMPPNELGRGSIPWGGST